MKSANRPDDTAGHIAAVRGQRKLSRVTSNGRWKLARRAAESAAAAEESRVTRGQVEPTRRASAPARFAFRPAPRRRSPIGTHRAEQSDDVAVTIGAAAPWGCAPAAPPRSAHLLEIEERRRHHQSSAATPASRAAAAELEQLLSWSRGPAGEAPTRGRGLRRVPAGVPSPARCCKGDSTGEP